MRFCKYTDFNLHAVISAGADVSHRFFADLILILSKIIVMRDSNTFIYIVAGVIILHFIAGFAYLLYKMTRSKSKDQIDSKDC
jgi:hypothetical protein